MPFHTSVGQEGREGVGQDHEGLVDLAALDALVREDEAEDEAEREGREDRGSSEDEGPYQGLHEGTRQIAAREHVAVVVEADEDAPARIELIALGVDERATLPSAV